MRKNEAGLTILETGDVVRIGNGKVEYTVVAPASNGTIGVRSHNTMKRTLVEEGRVNLVQSIQELTGVDRLDSGEGFPEDVLVKETSAYAKAVLFALNALGKHVYAGTVRKNVKAKRRGLNARQKASRKANR